MTDGENFAHSATNPKMQNAGQEKPTENSDDDISSLQKTTTWKKNDSSFPGFSNPAEKRMSLEMNTEKQDRENASKMDTDHEQEGGGGGDGGDLEQ